MMIVNHWNRVSYTHSLTKLLKYKVCYVKFRISRRLWINVYNIEIYKSTWSLLNCTKEFFYSKVFTCLLTLVVTLSQYKILVQPMSGYMIVVQGYVFYLRTYSLYSAVLYIVHRRPLQLTQQEGGAVQCSWLHTEQTIFVRY